jgi:hypothetical protein
MTKIPLLKKTNAWICRTVREARHQRLVAYLGPPPLDLIARLDCLPLPAMIDKRLQARTLEEGFAMMDELFLWLGCLDHIPKQARQLQQKQAHDMMAQCFVRLIFGANAVIYWNEIAARYGFTELREELLLAWARRQGKTWAMIRKAAALCHTIPGINIAIMSVVFKQAKMITGLIKTEYDNMKAVRHSPASRNHREDSGSLTSYWPDGRKTVLLACGAQNVDVCIRESDRSNGLAVKRVFLVELCARTRPRYLLFPLSRRCRWRPRRRACDHATGSEELLCV